MIVCSVVDGSSFPYLLVSSLWEAQASWGRVLRFAWPWNAIVFSPRGGLARLAWAGRKCA